MWRIIAEAVAQHERRAVAERRGKWRSFIQRSARQRRNSISSAGRCSVRTTAVVPSYSSTRSLTISPRAAEVLRHRRARVRRGMLDVGPVDVATGEFEIGLDRLARVVGVADDQAADHVHAVAVQVLDGRERRVAAAGRPARAACSWPRALQELQVVVQDVLDARGRRSGSRPAASAAPASSPWLAMADVMRLHDVVEVVQPGCRRSPGRAPRSAAR